MAVLFNLNSMVVANLVTYYKKFVFICKAHAVNETKKIFMKI